MRSTIDPSRIIKIVALIYLSINGVLFLLREIDQEWWFADYQSYASVDFETHLKAFVFFVIYLFLFLFVLLLCMKKKFHVLGVENKRNFQLIFFFITFLIVTQIGFALFDSVGVAGGIGTAPFYALPLLLFSPDGFYFAYALSEQNRKRLAFATILFVASNIVRGWAGFIIPLFFIFYIRLNGFSKKAIILSMLGFLIVVPILLVVRDYFRDGYSQYQLLQDSGFSGLSLITEYSGIALKLILSRFDLYSNYIGVLRYFGSGLPDYVCTPIIENVLAKVILYPFGGFDCTPLGGVLPGELYEFFRDKGTSYSVSSGFFALPFFDALAYFASYIVILIFTSIVIFRYINKSYYSIFSIYFFMVLLFQGWMYQFVYNFMGFIFFILLARITWSKSIRS